MSYIRSRLDLPLGRYSKSWTKKEDKILEKNLRNMTYEEIGEKLGRTGTAVKNRTYALGLDKSGKPKTIEEEIRRNKELNARNRKFEEVEEYAEPPESMVRLEEVKAYQLQPGQVYKLTKHNKDDKRIKRKSKKLICKENYQNIIIFECMKGICYSMQKIDFLTGEVKVERC